MKPKIFVDGRSFDTEYQGTRTYIQNIYNIIDKIGDLEVYVASENPDFTATFFPGSVNTHFIKYESKSKMERVLKEIPTLISKHKLTAAHFQYVIAPFLKDVVQVVTIHDILFKSFPAEFSYKYKLIKGCTFYLSAKKADILTTVSEYSKAALSQHYKIPAHKIHVIPNGVSPFYFESYNKEQSKIRISEKFNINNYILYVSRIEPRKNQLGLLKAYLELKLYERGKELVFVGVKSIEVPEIDHITNSLNSEIRSKIYFLENISDQDLRLLYQAADLFVYPSKAEGFGIPPLEAGALKVPTICSNTTASN